MKRKMLLKYDKYHFNLFPMNFGSSGNRTVDLSDNIARQHLNMCAL